MNALAVKGLCKRYPAFSLENVNFSVPEGAVMGFIGRNGAGKSTTLKALLGLVHPDAGEVTVLGKSFREEERYIKERIGVVLGGIDFYPKKKVRLLSDVTRRFYGNWQEEKYRHYLDLFDIDQEKRVDQLSTGMRVKYMIALALSHDARLLILDEPTSGLDPVSRNELTELLRRIAADGSPPTSPRIWRNAPATSPSSRTAPSSTPARWRTSGSTTTTSACRDRS